MAGYITSDLKRMVARHMLLVSDSCYSAPPDERQEGGIHKDDRELLKDTYGERK